MATWIFILHMVFPIHSDLLAAPTSTTAQAAGETDADGLVRYRGLEQMFARFEAEAEPV